MARVFFRLDDRLIHGQVIEGWIHNLGLTRVTIVSDRVAGDTGYRKILGFSVPHNINVDIFTVKQMVSRVNKGYLKKEDTIVLFESTADALELIDYGVEVPELNVGCLHYDGRNRKLRKNIAVSDDDIRNFIDISSMGTVLDCRSIPQDKKVDLINLIDGIK